jgi:hypothetical protein
MSSTATLNDGAAASSALALLMVSGCNGTGCLAVAASLTVLGAVIRLERICKLIAPRTKTATAAAIHARNRVKRREAKHLKVTANEAERLLEELNWQGELKQIYRNCNDPKLKLQIITVLQARSWGRPEIAKVAKHTEPPPSLNVNQTPSDRLLEILSRAAARRKKALAGGAD